MSSPAQSMPWYRPCIGGGCNPARPIADYIRSAGFREVCIEEFRLPLGPGAPHIVGFAIR